MKGPFSESFHPALTLGPARLCVCACVCLTGLAESQASECVLYWAEQVWLIPLLDCVILLGATEMLWCFSAGWTS